MGKGDFILEPENQYEFSNGEMFLVIKRRSIKHIVEKRKEDKYDLDELKKLLHEFTNIFRNKNYSLIKNISKGENSYLLVQNFFVSGVGVVVALELVILDGNKFYIKTMFYRSVTKIKNLLAKN
jgi:phosphoribosylformylglycinamidine (FGAM) synthase-like enzyme